MQHKHHDNGNGSGIVRIISDSEVHTSHYRWKLRMVEGQYVADGRPHAGRYRLGTDDFEEAVQFLPAIDRKLAIDRGLVQPSADELAGRQITIEDGFQRLLDHCARPSVSGGVRKKTRQRYESVRDKFCDYCRKKRIWYWSQVDRSVLSGYLQYLDNEDYAYATQYLEGTLIKQCMKFLADENLLPKSCLFPYHLRKPGDTTTYCYTEEEVEAMVAYCREERDELHWLGDVITTLAYTGMRIGELAVLRWREVDLSNKVIHVVDESRQGSRSDRASANTVKTGTSRAIPIHGMVLEVFERLARHRDGRVFHGPRGGRLKPDTVLHIFQREVIANLKDRFPREPGAKGLADGTIHGFRHYFCSMCASSGKVSAMTVSAWLGHKSSQITRRYFHLHDQHSQAAMAAIEAAGTEASSTSKRKKRTRKEAR